jgi:S-adenosylmethionine/arginine decarboxylase-like enzyme
MGEHIFAAPPGTTVEWDGDDGYVEEKGLKKDIQPFGFMLALDCYGCKESVLHDTGRIYAFLEMLVTALHMTKQAPPYVFLSPPEYLDKQGISGWVPLIESGIQIHTLSLKRFVSIDIYCCHRFDATTAIACTRLFFEPEDIDSQLMVRGAKL